MWLARFWNISLQQVRTNVRVFKENRQNKYRRNFLTQPLCSCWNNLPSNVVGAGTLNEFKSRLKLHFAPSPLLYDPRATWDSHEGLGARSLHAGAACSWIPIRSDPIMVSSYLLYYVLSSHLPLCHIWVCLTSLAYAMSILIYQKIVCLFSAELSHPLTMWQNRHIIFCLLTADVI